jgi:hypothetical protein
LPLITLTHEARAALAARSWPGKEWTAARARTCAGKYVIGLLDARSGAVGARDPEWEQTQIRVSAVQGTRIKKTVFSQTRHYVQRMKARNLFDRLNRKLKIHRNQRLSRDGGWDETWRSYALLDLTTGHMVATNIDLVALGRELYVLKPDERGEA